MRTRSSTSIAPRPGPTVADLAGLVFCTTLQPSENPSADTVRRAVERRLTQLRDPLQRSAEEVALRYGEDPDAASRRMQWSRAVVVALQLSHARMGPIV